MSYITKKQYAFFLLPLAKFCLFIAKTVFILLMLCYFLYWGADVLGKRMYERARSYLECQRLLCLKNARNRELLEEESLLNYCITHMKHEILSANQHRKQFYDCLSLTNMADHSCTVNERIKQSKVQSYEIYSYKISGTLSAIDQLFACMSASQSGLFCKSIVLTKEDGDRYSVNLVFKAYGLDKK